MYHSMSHNICWIFEKWVSVEWQNKCGYTKHTNLSFLSYFVVFKYFLPLGF